MLFFIGVEVGANETLTNQLGKLGAVALIVTIICCLTCAIASLAFYKFVYKGGSLRKKQDNLEKDSHNKTKFSVLRVLNEMKDSLIIVLFFIIGWIVGSMGYGEIFPNNGTLLCLYLLLFCVGFGLGQNRELKDNLKASKKRLLIMPLITIVATWIGSIITSFIFSDYSLSDWLAVGSGFGYYSLSSIIITDARGAELGTIALMYNVLRELIAIIFAPWIVKWAGPLAVISIGGATTADTTLPSVSRYAGKEFVPISIFHGILVDFTVPFLVPLFCAL